MAGRNARPIGALGARATLTQMAGLIASIVVISSLHTLTAPTRHIWHELYQRLYYVPVIIGAYWYGPWGGLLTAVLTSLACLASWSDTLPYAASQYAELVVFNVIGLTVGFLAASQRRVTARFREAAASLEAAYRELRDSQESLRRADRLSALGEIAAGLAHEIRNPLASVNGALEIITSRVQAGTPEAEFSGLASKELARLDGLVTEFLDYAHPHTPDRRDARLEDTIEHVAALLRPESEQAGVSIDVERTDLLPEVFIDREQIQQVIFNLTLNAIQASPRGGSVRIRQHGEHDSVVVDVIDEGPGIPQELVGRIFDPFFTTKEKGTGLGLAISHRIVTAHGGTIEIRPNPERGTCFRMRLPRQARSVGAVSGMEKTGK